MKYYYYILVLLFIICSCGSNKDIETMKEGIKKIYNCKYINISTQGKNIELGFYVDSCVYQNTSLNILKGDLVFDLIPDISFFDRIDTFSITTYTNDRKYLPMVQVFTKEIYLIKKNFRKNNKLVKCDNYINYNLNCNWLVAANGAINGYNITYKNIDIAPKYLDFIDLLRSASCEDFRSQNCKSIIVLEYINETVKSRLNSFPNYGHHVDSILSIIKSDN